MISKAVNILCTNILKDNRLPPIRLSEVLNIKLKHKAKIIRMNKSEYIRYLIQRDCE